MRNNLNLHPTEDSANNRDFDFVSMGFFRECLCQLFFAKLVWLDAGNATFWKLTEIDGL